MVCTMEGSSSTHGKAWGPGPYADCWGRTWSSAGWAETSVRDCCPVAVLRKRLLSRSISEWFVATGLFWEWFVATSLLSGSSPLDCCRLVSGINSSLDDKSVSSEDDRLITSHCCQIVLVTLCFVCPPLSTVINIIIFFNCNWTLECMWVWKFVEFRVVFCKVHSWAVITGGVWTGKEGVDWEWEA